MKTRRLQRLHFSSTPSFFKIAINCPQWQRASEAGAHGDNISDSRIILMLNIIIVNFENENCS